MSAGFAAGDERSAPSSRAVTRNLVLLAAASAAAGLIARGIGFESHQSISISVFLATILGTLFFWNFRVGIAFLGVSALILTKTLDIPHFVQASELNVILFLVGMMIVVGALRDLGLFTWVVQTIVTMPGITGRRFIMVTSLVAALLACAVDEVTSILFVAALVFQACDRLKLNPAPFIIISVLCTNVGSAGTMLGNPVGIYIGAKAGLSFEDFMVWAFPVMLVSLAAAITLLMVWYRHEIAEFDKRLQDRIRRDLSLAPRIKVPYKRALVVLIATIVLIASHHRIEKLLDLEPNTALLIAPLISAGLIMIWRRNRARHYLEHDVDWWTLVFFMMLFAVAGTLEYSGISERAAASFAAVCGRNVTILTPVVLLTTAIGSAFVDNVIFVAAFSPVVKNLGEIGLHVQPLWWALLFGACFGGNITMIGSTANIVALGMLEKRVRAHLRFIEWFKIGVVVALVTGIIAWLGITLLTAFMPGR